MEAAISFRLLTSPHVCPVMGAVMGAVMEPAMGAEQVNSAFSVAYMLSTLAVSV